MEPTPTSLFTYPASIAKGSVKRHAYKQALLEFQNSLVFRLYHSGFLTFLNVTSVDRNLLHHGSQKRTGFPKTFT